MSGLNMANERESYEQLVAAETVAGVYDTPWDFAEPGIGYIGPLATPAAIIRRLENARDWLAIKPSLGTATQRKRYRPSDDLIVIEIVIACVNVLRQSPRDYSGWVTRHKLAVRKLKRSAVRQLVELAISDADANPLPIRMPPQLEQFSGGELVNAAKKSKAAVCDHCGKTFYPIRKSKYCGPNCKKWAAHRRQKSGVSGDELSKAA